MLGTEGTLGHVECRGWGEEGRGGALGRRRGSGRLAWPRAGDGWTTLWPDRLARPGPVAWRRGGGNATGLSAAEGAALIGLAALGVMSSFNAI